MCSMVAGTWHDLQTRFAFGSGGRNKLLVPIFQMRDATFASGSERSTNHVPLHHAGCLMAGAPFASARASAKSLTEHHANGRSGRGEDSNAQLHLRSKWLKDEQHGFSWRRKQTSAHHRTTLRCSSGGSGPGTLMTTPEGVQSMSAQPSADLALRCKVRPLCALESARMALKRFLSAGWNDERRSVAAVAR